MRPSTPWIIALLASVLINGVLAGFVLHRTADGPDWRRGADHDGDAPHHRGRRSAGYDLRDLLYALPDDVRREARERARDDIEDIRALFDEARAARDDFDTAMRAERFDREAAADALQRLREVRETLELNLQEDVLDLVGDLDAQTRARILEERREDRHRRFRRRHDGPGQEGPPPPDGEGPPDGPSPELR